MFSWLKQRFHLNWGTCGDFNLDATHSNWAWWSESPDINTPQLTSFKGKSVKMLSIRDLEPLNSLVKELTVGLRPKEDIKLMNLQLCKSFLLVSMLKSPATILTHFDSFKSSKQSDNV